MCNSVIIYKNKKKWIKIVTKHTKMIKLGQMQ